MKNINNNNNNKHEPKERTTIIMKIKTLIPILSLALGLSATQGMAQTAWSLTGNAGTTPGTHFLGTTDNKMLMLKVNNHPGLRIEPTDAFLAGTVNIVAGALNSIETSSFSASISGGNDNSIQGACNHAVIGGGNGNVINYSSYVATIAGGRNNTIGAYGYFTTIGGGQQNTALDDSNWSIIGGGRYNIVGGNYSTVPGGRNNEANGSYSFAAGYGAKANHVGSFVWNDGSRGAFASTADNQFLIHAAGGVGINTASPEAGTALDVAGQIRSTTLLLTSDRNAKANFLPVDNRAVLQKVARLPLSTWHYTNAPGVRHLGPMAQDFKAAFPDLGSDDKHIATVDADGVALASIQALHELMQEKDTEIAALRRQVSALETRLAGRLVALEKAMSKNVLQASFHPEAVR